MIENIIRKVKPDYIQCDCKGHRGFSSYPTKVGHPAPGFVRDQLRIWRDVTARHHVALFMHYSGVWDTEALRRHGSWARVDEKGKRDKDITSVFGPYVDNLLIPQIKELCDEYGIDGIWLDGECWATKPDYGKKVLRAFREKTGITSVPREPGDPHYFEFAEFCREGFRKYLDHYVTALHRHNPDLQICSNWAYSSQTPEPVGTEVDFLSGDYPLTNSVNAARLEVRCLVHQGKPWDLMAWGFVSRFRERNFSTKSAPQLQQEAAVVLALGGGFQVYFTQKKDGSVSPWPMETMGEVAKFCRKRQQFCHKATPIPQIALVYASRAYYRKNRNLFVPHEDLLTPMQGLLQSLLDAQNIVDITMEHHLAGRMHDPRKGVLYPLIVLPEWEYLGRGFKKELLEYVASGGKLLVIGPGAAALFKKQLGVRFVDKAQERENWLGYDNRLAGLKTSSQKVKLKSGVDPFGKIYPENDFTSPSTPAASIAKYGKGKIAGVYINLGERYAKAATTTAREFLSGLVRKLFPNPLVEVSGSQYVDVTANRIDDLITINLINTAGPHADENVYVFDEIPPIGPLTVKIRWARRPKEVRLEPEGISAEWTWRGGHIRLTIPKLDIHTVITIRE